MIKEVKKETAKLYLIPTPIGDKNLTTVLPQETLFIIPQIKHFLVENIRTARRFLKDANYPHDFVNVHFFEVNENNQFKIDAELLKPLSNQFPMALLSEAGIPCVADPGFTVVRLAHRNGFKVVPLGGPSAIVKALMASGLNGQQFTFHGYLPIKKYALVKFLKKAEQQAYNGYTQIFIETPYRNERIFETIISTCSNNTLLCVASAIDTERQFIITKHIAEWKKTKKALKGQPCVFLLGT